MRPLEDPPMDMSKKTTGLSAAGIAFAFGVCGGGGSLALGAWRLDVDGDGCFRVEVDVDGG